MPHHPAGQLPPETVLDLGLGLGAAQERQAERVDTRSQDGQRGGQHRDRQECGQRHRRDRAVGHRLEEALRHDQQTGECRDDDRRREHDGLTRGHHGSADRGLRRIAFGEFLAEPADDEQAVVDGDAQADQRDHRLGEDVQVGGQGQDLHDAQRTGDGQAADEHGQHRRHRTTEHEEQHEGDQREGDELGAVDVLVHATGHRAGDRLQTGGLESGSGKVESFGDAGEFVFDLLEVLQDFGVVVTLDADGDECLRAVRREELFLFHFLGGLCGGRGTDRLERVENARIVAADDVGILVDEGIDELLDLRPERLVVDSGALRGRDQHDDVGFMVASECRVGDLRTLDRLGRRVEPAALTEVFAQVEAEKAEATHHQDEYGDHRIPQPEDHGADGSEHSRLLPRDDRVSKH